MYTNVSISLLGTQYDKLILLVAGLLLRPVTLRRRSSGRVLTYSVYGKINQRIWFPAHIVMLRGSMPKQDRVGMH